MKNGLNKKIVISILLVFILLIFGRIIFYKTKTNDEISGVRKVLSVKYDNIECINDCNYIMSSNKKDKEYLVNIYDNNGIKKVGFQYDKQDIHIKDVTDNYYIIYDKNSFIVKDFNNKEIYSSNDYLKKVNDSAFMCNQKIIDINKREIYNNVSDLKNYSDYVQFKSNNNYYIIDKNNKELLKNYKISEIIYDISNKEYSMIVKSTITNKYSYYVFSKEKIIGNEFDSYNEKDGKYYIYINNSKHVLHKNGNQVKTESLNDILIYIKGNIDINKYSIYEESIYSKKQKNIIVKDNNEKTVGILNIKNNKYTKIFNNEQVKMSLFDTQSKDKYILINNNIIYNLSNTKKIYETKKNLIDIVLYKDNYKIVRIDDKYILLDNNNKELYSSSQKIAISDKKCISNNNYTDKIYLYSIKNNKLVSSKLLTQINDNLYKYVDNNLIYIINTKGKILNKIKEEDLINNNDVYIYKLDNTLNIYNLQKNKIYDYKLKENEDINNSNIFKNVLFVTNDKDNYIKVISFKGSMIKIINNKLSELKITKDKTFIIVSDEGKYGLYIAE